MLTMPTSCSSRMTGKPGDAVIAQDLLDLAHRRLGRHRDQAPGHDVADLQLVDEFLGLEDFGGGHLVAVEAFAGRQAGGRTAGRTSRTSSVRCSGRGCRSRRRDRGCRRAAPCPAPSGWRRRRPSRPCGRPGDWRDRRRAAPARDRNATHRSSGRRRTRPARRGRDRSTKRRSGRRESAMTSLKRIPPALIKKVPSCYHTRVRAAMTAIIMRRQYFAVRSNLVRCGRQRLVAAHDHGNVLVGFARAGC